MPVERIDFDQNVGDEALAGFHDEGQRAREFAEAGDGLQQPIPVQEQMVGTPGMSFEDEQREFAQAMEGERHQTGVQHDLQTRGFTSDDAVQQAVNYEQHNWNELEQIPVTNQQPQQDFQQLYGQSENEKGELRRALQEQMEANKQLMAQMQTVMQPAVTPPNFYGDPGQHQVAQQAPQEQYTAVPQQPQRYDLSGVKFVDKPDDEMVLAGDVNDAIRNQVAPYVIDAMNRAAAAEQRSLQSSRQLFESHKLQMGITPQVEQAALAQQPWIRNIADPQAYLGALQSFKTQADRVQLAQSQQPNPVPQAQQQGIQQRPMQQANQGQRMLRRTTYVEGQGQRMAGEAGSAQQVGQQQWEAAWAATMNLPFEKRAGEQRKLLATRGIQSVTGYRDPMVLTQ